MLESKKARAKALMSKKSAIFVDAHVHLSFFAWDTALDWALFNFRQAMAKEGDIDFVCGVLCLADTPEDVTPLSLWEEVDCRLKQYSRTRKHAWQTFRTKEPESATLMDRWGNRLFLIRGFQVETREKLEVLTLLTHHPSKYGESLNITLKRAIEQDTLTVIPWGAGKWLGKRGKILSEALKNNYSRPVCLGDNGGRPFFWKRIPQFQQADYTGIPILRGSDPLPLPWEVRRIGSFGFKISGDMDFEWPAAYLKNLILEKKSRIQNFGRLEKPFSFFRNQIFARMKRTLHRPPTPALSRQEHH